MATPDLLLVEGTDDEQFFVHLFKYHRLPLSEPRLSEPGKITIDRAGGIERLRQSLPIRLSIVETRHIGVVVDADDAAHDKWTSLRALLEGVGYVQLPQSLAPGGLVITQGGMPTVGIWVMPDNHLPGALGNLAHALIPGDDILWNHVEACIDAIPESARRWRPSYLMKAKMHTWLAWQEEPGAPIGQAVSKRFLSADAQQVQPLLAWIRRLFEL